MTFLVRKIDRNFSIWNYIGSIYGLQTEVRVHKGVRHYWLNNKFVIYVTSAIFFITKEYLRKMNELYKTTFRNASLEPETFESQFQREITFFRHCSTNTMIFFTLNDKKKYVCKLIIIIYWVSLLDKLISPTIIPSVVYV